MTDEHRRPSSAEIDIARLREKHSALGDDVHEIKQLVKEIHARQADIHTSLALGNQRMGAIETSQTDTTERVQKLEEGKSNIITHILSVLSQVGLWGVK